MRRYAQVSAVLFALISLAQLTRSLLTLPAQVGGIDIPVWMSVIAFLVTGAFSMWGFRVSR